MGLDGRLVGDSRVLLWIGIHIEAFLWVLGLDVSFFNEVEFCLVLDVFFSFEAWVKKGENSR